MYVILLGPPGVGKGTQGALLAEKMDWQRLATGDLLRAAKAAGSPLGHEAQTYMTAGELVPDRVIIDMVKEKLTSALNTYLAPMRERLAHYEKETGLVDEIILAGTERMQAIARDTMREVRKAMGLSGAMKRIRRAVERRRKKQAR